MGPISRVVGVMCVLAFSPWASASAVPAEVYFVQGYHGGYYLTSEAAYQEALDKLFGLLDRHPDFKTVFELEPYTLERMKSGEKFACEKFRRDKPAPARWALGGQGDGGASADAGAARSGRWGVRLALCGGAYVHAVAVLEAEKFRGRTLIFSGWIRQPKGSGAHLYIDAWDWIHYLAGSSARTAKVPDDGQWHRVEMTWRVPESASRIFPQAKCDRGPTEADFDDLSLKDAQTGEELLPNGDFEQVARLALRDEARLERLRHFMRRGQIEIVGGAYTQPIFYAVGDESALRQFVYGTRAVEDALGAPVKIYAAQEPGLCPELPQMLRQAGVDGALYRTLWCIFGSPPHRNAESVIWVGPDGSGIPAVPSYEVFPLPRYGLTGRPSPKWVTRLKEVGLERPLFVTLHDFLPKTVDVPKVDAQVVTLGGYFQTIGPPKQPWPDAFKGFEFRFPYGLLAGEVQRGDRESENLLLQAERLLAIAGVDGGGRLDDAWEAHLMGEHHDGWVCAPAIFGIWRQPTYAQMCKSAFDEARAIGLGLMQKAGCAARDEAGRPHASGAEFAIVNTSGFARHERVSILATLPPGAAKAPAVFLGSTNGRAVPSEVRVLSRHDGGSAKEIEAVLLAGAPAMGYERYRVADGPGAVLPQVGVLKGDLPGVDNGRVRLTASREGVQVGGAGGAPLRMLLAGYFPGKGDLKVAVPITQVRSEGASAWASGEGRLGSVPFKAAFRIDPETPLVRMRLEFDFGEKTEVGAQEDLNEKGLPAHARDDRKLRLVIPLPPGQPKFFSHAAFEVRRVDEDRYPVLRYAAAEGEGGGIALFTDRATMGLFRADPPAMEIVLAYGGKFLYAPHDYAPLVGKHVFEIGLLFYEGGWQKARLAQWSEVFSQPLLVVNSVRSLGGTPSLVTLEPEDGAIITALRLDGKHLLVRLWQPLEGQRETRVHVAGKAKWAATDLLHRRHENQGETVRLRQHQFLTLCAELDDRK